MRNERLGRELKLILLLTGNRRYSVQQLCEEISVSPRTLYYYLDYLRAFGFHIEKQGTTYRIDSQSSFFTKLFRKVHFTEEEAIFMRRLLVQSGAHGALADHLKQKLDSLYDLQIINDEAHDTAQAQHLSTLYEAIKLKRCVVLHGYSSSHSQSQKSRIVEPFMLLGGNSEVRCYEINARMNKTFRLSRMQRVELLADEWRFEHLHRQLFTDLFRFSGEELHHVTLHLDRLAYNLLIEEYPPSAAFITPVAQEQWLLQTDVCSYQGVGRFVMGLYENITILGDEGFQSFIAQKLSRIQQSLEGAAVTSPPPCDPR